MSIEKPFSTIRKAVEGRAEEAATFEGLETPTSKHYKREFNILRVSKMFNPENYERDLIIGARAKELKDAMGKEKYIIFNDILKEIEEKYDKEKSEKESLLSMQNFHDGKARNDYLILNEKYLTMKANELKLDPRIIAAFKENMNLVDETLLFIKNSVMERLKDYINQPAVKMLDPNIIARLYTKFLKLFRNIK